jgi:pimeloyl-ACP methyl ester carboxylesterase
MGDAEYLETIYEPSSAPGPDLKSADIVFVHGLNPRSSPDFARATWTHANENFWPKDQLSQALPNSRVLLFSYNSRVASDISTNGIHQHANNLLDRLSGKRGANNQQLCRPIIFVAHSLGGLVVKEALVTAKSNDRYKEIRESTRGLVFFGVPHQGGNGVDLGAIVANIVNALTGSGHNDLVDSLKKNSLFQEHQSEHFKNQLEDYQVVSVVEDKPTKISIFRKMVCPPFLPTPRNILID